MDGGEAVMIYLLQIGAAALAMVLVAGHQAPGEGWLAPAFMGVLAALLVDQAWALRRRAAPRADATRAECPLP
jgi:hypothetical protein